MAADTAGARGHAALDAFLAAPDVTGAANLLADGDAITALLRPLVTALANDPLFEPPLRVSRDAIRQVAVLRDTPRARMTASVVSARALAAAPPPSGVVLSGHVVATRYHRASGVCVRRWRRARRGDRLVEIAPLWPENGAVVVHDGRCEVHALAAARRDVVTAGIVLREATAPLVCEYDVTDGRPLRLASGDEAQSRRLLLLTLLRVMRRGDAGDVFVTATHDAAHHARWSAMREWLALDTLAALPRLAEMSVADAHPDVRRAAAATLARARDGRAPCRA